jgi:hypothetical protein
VPKNNQVPRTRSRRDAKTAAAKQTRLIAAIGDMRPGNGSPAQAVASLTSTWSSARSMRATCSTKVANPMSAVAPIAATMNQ